MELALSSFAELKRDFCNDYFAREPEESTTLGIRGQGTKLKQWSADAIGDELLSWRGVRDRLRRIPVDQLSRPDRIDYDVIDNLVTFHLRIYDERQEHLWNARASLYSYSILQYQVPQARSTRDWERIAERIGQIPRFLREQTQNLRLGDSLGLRPAKLHVENTIAALDGDVLSYFAAGHLTGIAGDLLTPALRSFLEAVVREAATAFASHAQFLKSETLPTSSGSFGLGRTEYRWRLRNVLGAPIEPEDIATQGWSLLKTIQKTMIKRAQVLEPAVKDLPSAFALLSKLRDKRPTTNDEAMSLYKTLTERALAFVQKKQLFRIPGALQLRIIPTPPGIAVSVAANWPAPLLDTTQEGFFLVNLTDGPSAHTNVDAASIAVHEGIPGHYLQSFWWQQRFSADPSPVRFLLVADDVNVFRNHWGTNVNIEGFALYVENLMLEQGFYSDEEALGALAGQALRAGRMIADVGLHVGRLSVDEAAQLLQKEVCLDARSAQREALRYTRMPLQAITYMLGRLQIEELKSAYRHARGPSYREDDFHDEFFAFGPVRPTLIATEMLRDIGTAAFDVRA